MASRLSHALVDFYKRVYGRGPVATTTLLSADVAVTVMRSILTPGEQTLVVGGKLEQIEQMRLRTAEVARPELISMAERALARKVAAAVTGVGVCENVATETFFLDSVPPAAGEAAEGDQSDQGHDQSDPEAPDEHQDDADDDEDST